jgi:hypothetical protein
MKYGARSGTLESAYTAWSKKAEAKVGCLVPRISR